ncbi:MAG: hypothetical protein KGL13_09285 [Gammaproteobacteria bacterium]|nr:hypothetical protein [Gammaproteobacteria bacterium]MDE2346647.1 hypothetical protein [Gammaproteobacteria bacterium]
MRNRLITLIACLFLYAGAAVPGFAAAKFHTMVPKSQIPEVTKHVEEWHNQQYPDCKFVSLVGIKVVKQHKDTSNEVWTILGCDHKQFQYRVFIKQYFSGISSEVSNLDYSPLKVHKN